MFRGLHLRLTLLYALAALAVVVLVSGGVYFVVARYFRDVTDLALQKKMTYEFHALAAPIPKDLAAADRDWSLLLGEITTLGGNRKAVSVGEARQIAEQNRKGAAIQKIQLTKEQNRPAYEVKFADGFEVYVDAYSGQILATKVWYNGTGPTATSTTAAPSADVDTAYNGELAAIFVLPLDRAGRLLFDPNPAAAPVQPNMDALAIAMARGSDLRSVVLPDGRNVRMLTYRLTRSDGPAVLQLGRVLSDQEQVLGRLTLGLLALGSLSMALVGVGSWMLAARALRPAQQSWERQQRFIASASHELRTPLTLMRASAEVALRGTALDDADQRELLGDVISESDHMRRLVDDLLTLSRIDSGKLPITVASVDLPVLLAETQRQAARLGEQHGVAVDMGDVAGAVQADPDRLRQVLLILLDNALRHTPAGGHIWLTATSQGRLVRLSVADTGCGIPEEHLPLIFERFYRADPARGRSGGNAGLGLSIAKGLVEVMGGQIGAESEPGQGTTIWLALPAAS
jgi:signal transduction histidine kinase